MQEELYRIRRLGWSWNLKSPELLDHWFEHYADYMESHPIKTNRLRTVFKVPVNGQDGLYVKYDHPASSLTRLKARFRPKARAEFESAMLLEKLAVPVVEYVGWGRKGTEGMLISKELRSASSARAYWYEYAPFDRRRKARFLSDFSTFLGRFFQTGLFHPDFHLGNLLLAPDLGVFYLVDPYGLRLPEKLRTSQFFRMYRIVGALRGELTDEEAEGLLLSSGLANRRRDAEQLWQAILKAETREMKQLWPKRREQLKSGNSKYSLEIGTPAGPLAIRRSMAGRPLLEVEKGRPELNEQQMTILALPTERAEQLWLASFLLQFHRLPGQVPLAWLKKAGGVSQLFFEKRTVGLDFDFSARFALAGIKKPILPEELCRDEAGLRT